MPRLWRLRKHNVIVDAELRELEPDGVEVTFLYNGDASYRRRWPTRDEAVAEAAAKRAELEREGWSYHW
jgi:hypothetical protein